MQRLRTYYRAFRAWTHHRPFAGGICLVISAILIGLPSLNNFRIGDLILTVSTISGVSTVVLAIAMGVCAVAALFWLHVRVIAGIAAMIVALVAFPAANFGGYVLGTLLGVVGASLVLAWRPLEEELGDDADTAVDGPAASAAVAPAVDQLTIEHPVVDQPTIEHAVVDPSTVDDPVVGNRADAAAPEAPTQTLPVPDEVPEPPAAEPGPLRGDS